MFVQVYVVDDERHVGNHHPLTFIFITLRNNRILERIPVADDLFSTYFWLGRQFHHKDA